MDPTGSSTGDDDNLDGQGCSTKRKFGENFQVETLHPLSSFSLFYFFQSQLGFITEETSKPRQKAKQITKRKDKIKKR